MNLYFIFLFIYLGTISTINCNESAREGKFIAALVSFPSDLCTVDNDIGTCVSKKKCTRMGGRNLGTCAHGYGSCCKFTAQCTTMDETITVTRNQTVLQTPTMTPRTCTFAFPRQPGVCQLRLDFPQFNLNKPTDAGDCPIDSMTVSNTVTIDGLQICGSGASAANHMYLDYGNSNGPIQVVLKTQGATMGASLPANYGYMIRVTQIKCDSPAKVPQDCLQYYTSSSGVVSSYNYGTVMQMGQQMNTEDYKVCIQKQNPGDRIQWTLCNGTTMTGPTVPFAVPENMCLVGPPPCVPQPAGACDGDYVEIPGSDMNRYCGAGIFPRSITTSSFWIRVRFDDTELQAMQMPIPLQNPPCTPVNVPGYTFSPNPCQLVPTRMLTVDMQNRGFCLAYNIVPSSTPLGDVTGQPPAAAGGGRAI